MIFLGSLTSAGYSITSRGVSCKDKGMKELNNEAECESAAPKIQNIVPNSMYSGDVTMDSRPPGCFYHPYAPITFHWNNDKNGNTCSSCISVCKGPISNSLY